MNNDNDIDEIIDWLKISAIDERKVFEDGNRADDYDQIAEWLEELKHYKEIENSNGRSFLTTDQVHDLCTEAQIKGRADMLKEIEEAMYTQCFVHNNDEDMQKWDSGNWFRYKLFENVVEQLKGQKNEWLEELKELRKFKEDFKDLGKLYSEIRADERNNVLSTLKKLIDSDYKSKDCQLLFADLCKMLVEQLKESKND